MTPTDPPQAVAASALGPGPPSFAHHETVGSLTTPHLLTVPRFHKALRKGAPP
jgi:hypothetical protein